MTNKPQLSDIIYTLKQTIVKVPFKSIF